MKKKLAKTILENEKSANMFKNMWTLCKTWKLLFPVSKQNCNKEKKEQIKARKLYTINQKWTCGFTVELFYEKFNLKKFIISGNKSLFFFVF